MPNLTDHTHDPHAHTWLEDDVPNGAGGAERRRGFAVQTLPYGVFSTAADDGAWRLGVGIGHHILDLAAAKRLGLVDDLDGRLKPALRASRLNPLLSLSAHLWTALRHRLFALLVDDESGWRGARDLVRQCLVPMDQARLHLPLDVGDYTDFYASIHHATNVGTMLRPDQPLLPNYRHVPIGYHGRASSVIVSGTEVRRPLGQTLPSGADRPTFGPSQRLDYELEIGLVIGGENALGEPVPIARALERVFGLVILNDWSARDIQAWEYQPLGPFLSKSFASSISPWVVPLDALAAHRVPVTRRADDPIALDYLFDEADQAAGAIDLELEVHLSTTRSRELGQPPDLVSRSNLRDLYWTPAQLVAHHTSNGCNLRPGDLLGTGTVSGQQPDARGCLLERTWRGTEPLTLSSGELRRFLEDGDEVVMESPLLPALQCLGRIGPALSGW